jgi:hypothetical protein
MVNRTNADNDKRQPTRRLAGSAPAKKRGNKLEEGILMWEPLITHTTEDDILNQTDQHTAGKDPTDKRRLDICTHGA